MKLTEAPWPAIRHEVAFALGPNIYRLNDHRLAIHDQACGKALIVEIDTPVTGERKCLKQLIRQNI